MVEFRNENGTLLRLTEYTLLDFIRSFQDLVGGGWRMQETNEGILEANVGHYSCLLEMPVVLTVSAPSAQETTEELTLVIPSIPDILSSVPTVEKVDKRLKANKESKLTKEEVT